MKIRKTTFLKFFIGSFAVILLISWLFFKFSTNEIKNIYVENGINELHKICISLYNSFKFLILAQNRQKIDKLCKKYGEQLGIRITVISRDGTVLGDSHKSPDKMENHINRPEIINAMRVGEGYSIRYSTTLDCYLVYYAVRITNGSNTIGFLRASLFLKDINREVKNIKENLRKIFFLILLASGFVSLVLSKTLTMPIEDMIDKVSQIAKGDFKVRITRLRKGELGYLARNINDMAERLELLFNELKREKENLKYIIDSIPIGLCVISLNDEVLIANKTLKNIIHQYDIEGKPYWESFREAKFNIFIQKFKKELKNLEQEIPIDNRLFLCNIMYIKENKRFIVSFYDLTPLKETERIKKDFVTNVSHELKTPITLIKGYLETLMEMETDEEKNKYLDIIDRNTTRLFNIINDLLLLSELETKAHLNIEDINIKDVMKNIHELFISKLKEKGLYFKISIPQSLKFIRADRSKLEQALINLVDNAIKYTEKGGISIMVAKEEENIKIEISDTGIGISKEHISRIFERFYVVDRSRSRKKGGTGLGLSIVKHIIELHNGKISVKSFPHKGTIFSISIPQVI